jgi:hypothetical protein
LFVISTIQSETARAIQPDLGFPTEYLAHGQRWAVFQDFDSPLHCCKHFSSSINFCRKRRSMSGDAPLKIKTWQTSNRRSHPLTLELEIPSALRLCVKSKKIA